MKSIKLNHSLQPTLQKPLATFLLSVMIVMLVLSLFFLQQSRTRLAGLHKEKVVIARAMSPSTEPPPLTESERAELDAVNIAINEILQPWPQLFNALEASRLDSINMIAIEPNERDKTVHITAVTSAVDEILEYISALKQQAIVSSVSLLSTESVRINGKDATQFELLVKW